MMSKPVTLEVERDKVIKLRKELEDALYPKVEFKGTSEASVKAMEEEAHKITRSMLYRAIGFIDINIKLPKMEN